MKIIFMGTPQFAVPSLQKLHTLSNHTIQAVFTGTDKRRSRYISYTPIKQYAVQQGLKVITCEDLTNPSLQSQIKLIAPDIIVVVAFRIIPASWLLIPRYGCVNVHASLLPKYRGASPIQYAILNGERETGCTTFLLNPYVDKGDILLHRKLAIEPHHTTGDLSSLLSHLGADLLLETLDGIEKGNIKKQPQTLNGSYAPKIYKQHAKLNLNESVVEIDRKIRAYSPSPGAWGMWQSKRLIFLRSTIAPKQMHSKAVGTIFHHKEHLYLVCNDGLLSIHELQVEGKKVQTAISFINGYLTSDIQEYVLQ